MEALKIVETDRTQEVINRCKRYIANNGLSIPKMAKLLRNPDEPDKELNRSTLHQVLSGQYSALTVGKYIDEIERYLDSAEDTACQDKPSLPVKPAFIPTRDALEALGICKRCQEDSAIGVIVGESGYGKSHTLRQYIKKPKVIYIPCGVNTKARDILRVIEGALYLPKVYNSIQERTEHVAEYFKNHPGYLLVLDEADKIFGKNTTRPLDTVRDIYDAASEEDEHHLGVVITGEPILESQLKNYMLRFQRRVDLHCKMEGLTKEEATQYLEGFQLTDDARDELIYRACNKQNGCFRLLDRTMRNVIRLLQQQNQTEITLQTIRDASSMMMF